MIAVIGGGPAGSVAAIRLRQLGQEVLVLERETFPRFRLGESLLPQSLHVLEALGVLEDARARFMVKRGAQFHDAASEKVTRFSFDGAFDHRIPFAFQVPRDEFDTLLLARASALGAEVRHGWHALHAVREGERVVGVEARDPSGTTQRIRADFVLDASGRDALFAHHDRRTEKLAGLENTAFYTHFHGMPRDAGDHEGDVHIVLLGSGAASGWFWVIPFKDGRTSVGAVVSRSWLQTHGAKGASPQILLERAIAACPAMVRLLGAGTALFPPRAAADFSYRVGAMHGPGWAAVGDAGGFIDPLFSTGVHVAMWGAFECAPAVVRAIAGDATGLAQWEAHVRSGADLFLATVRGFYLGRLQPYIFSDNPRTYLRRAITSLLSGDVFADTRYTRDMHTRLRAMLG